MDHYLDKDFDFDTDPATLTGSELIAALIDLERLRARLEFAQVRLIVAHARAGHPPLIRV